MKTCLGGLARVCANVAAHTAATAPDFGAWIRPARSARMDARNAGESQRAPSERKTLI